MTSIQRPSIARLLRLRIVLLAALLALAPVLSAQAEKLTVNFREADIRAVLESVSEITRRSFIIDPRVQGKITIISPESLESDMLYDVVLSALQVHGFQAVEDGAVTRIVPFSQSFQVAGGDGGNEIQTVVLRTNYIKASELLPSLKPMLSKGALLQAHDASNHIIVTDTRAQIARVRSIVADLDNPQQGAVDIIALKHISAGEALHIAGQLVQFQGQNLSIVEDVHKNRLIISGNPTVRQDLKALIRQLDVAQGDMGGIEVVRLNYAQAEPMKVLLEGILKSSLFSRKVLGEGKDVESAYRIEADTANNALVIAAESGVSADILKVVRQLDVPRKQVLIEAIVAEISEDQAKVLSAQLAVAGREGGAIINFNDLLPALIGLGLDDDIEAGDVANLPLGRGLTGGGISWDDDKKRGFGLLLEALKSDANTNILSTPSIVTLDNQEATISVGQEVPFITGNYVSNNNSVSNPFQTIERKEIGVKLKVLPQINDGEMVRMAIEQETSNLLATAAATGTADVVTAKRLITTNVMVGDSEFLVLGGLIDESFSGDDSKVPVLGSIPVLGHLFRSRSRSSNHSVLMVFIRPTILDTQSRMADATREKYDYLRNRQLNFIDSYEGEVVSPPLPEQIEEIHRSDSSHP
ncbi:MAG: hypothetical protein VR73_11810 [Gammaproteobacteria bacterium BRH_c0]|nr:MAG: hypothetical protein VR73_11810 [Gammaproteobacteria bacterium BRH_c0]